jgi:hypothetical protein
MVEKIFTEVEIFFYFFGNGLNLIFYKINEIKVL